MKDTNELTKDELLAIIGWYNTALDAFPSPPHGLTESERTAISKIRSLLGRDDGEPPTVRG